MLHADKSPGDWQTERGADQMERHNHKPYCSLGCSGKQIQFSSQVPSEDTGHMYYKMYQFSILIFVTVVVLKGPRARIEVGRP